VNPNGIDEISSSKLSRGLYAFTHLYQTNSEIENLFWSMVGIEALYVSGNTGISEQIRKKAQIFLGEISEFKKRLTAMYEYRSGFMHGSKNFPSLFHIHDALENYDKFLEDFGNAVDVASSLLIATLQKMAKMNLDDLDFDYVLKQ
jgi:hypothetical protein